MPVNEGPSCTAALICLFLVFGRSDLLNPLRDSEKVSSFKTTLYVLIFVFNSVRAVKALSITA